jgi:hypothetical protein
MERLSHTYDYAGNLIFIYKDVLDSQKNLIKLSNQQYLYIVQTLLNPIIIIEFNNRRKRYYYHTDGSLEQRLYGHHVFIEEDGELVMDPLPAKDAGQLRLAVGNALCKQFNIPAHSIEKRM